MKTLYFTICATLISFGFSSCVKQPDQVLARPTVTTPATSFSSISASENFNWSTTNKINFSFTASNENAYQLVLKVTAPDGAILFQKLQKSNEDYKGIIEIPVHYASATVSYGSLNKSFDCTTGAIVMTIN